MADSTASHWPTSVRLLHWLGVLLLLGAAMIGLLMVDMEKGSDLRRFCYGLHKSLGIAALGLGLLRLCVRSLTRGPAPLPGPAWQLRLAHLSHVLMYVLLLALPLSGWLLNSVAGQPLPWFGLFELPALAAKNPAWRGPLDTAHVVLFWTLVGMVVMHVSAVVHHGLYLRDDTLQRMLPARRARG